MYFWSFPLYLNILFCGFAKEVSITLAKAQMHLMEKQVRNKYWTLIRRFLELTDLTFAFNGHLLSQTFKGNKSC